MWGCRCYLCTHRCICAECSFLLPGSFSPVNPVLSYFVGTECCAHRAAIKPLSTCGHKEIKTRTDSIVIYCMMYHYCWIKHHKVSRNQPVSVNSVCLWFLFSFCRFDWVSRSWACCRFIIWSYGSYCLSCCKIIYKQVSGTYVHAGIKIDG